MHAIGAKVRVIMPYRLNVMLKEDVLEILGTLVTLNV